MTEAAGKVYENYDIKRLLAFLPHRYPFLLVDRIVEARGDEYGVGIKNVTFNEPQFQGHFPGSPVMPGVLLIEGMAQTAGALCVASQAVGAKPSVVYLMTIDKAKFRKPVVPGDQVRFHMTRIAKRRNMWWFRGEAKVDGVLVLRSGSVGDAGARNESDAIHPTAVVEDGARLGVGRRDRAVLPSLAARSTLGDGVRLVSHVSVAGDTAVGARTRIFPFASIGHPPQDLKYRGEPVRLIDRRGLPDPRRRDDESGHRGRRRRDNRRPALRCFSPTRMSRMTAASARASSCPTM